MGLFDWVKTKQDEKRKEKEAEEELRRQAEAEVSDEVVRIKKEKIKAQILAQAKGELPEKKTGLSKLAEEFKGVGLGNDSQMEKLMGKSGSQPRNNLTNEKLQGAILERKSFEFDQEKILSKPKGKVDSVGTLGGDTKASKDYASLIGQPNIGADKLREMASVKRKTK